MKIDAFAHALTSDLQKAVLGLFKDPPPTLRNWGSLRTLFDVDRRLELLDEHGIDMQIVTPPSPPLETLADGPALRELVTIANDSMAQMVGKHAERLRGVATVPLDDVEWAITEARRSVSDLGLIGLLVYASPDARPLDAPELTPFYAAVEDMNVPLWLHPDRSGHRPDYVGEESSRYAMNLILGWPYETSVAMARLAFSGTLRRHPRLRILAHHAGAMIPFFANRIQMHFKPPKGLEPEDSILSDLRRFHVDTVTWGSVGALMNSYELFGSERMLFATDAPFGPDGGRAFVRASIEAVQRMPVPDEEREALWSRNIVEFCGLETM